MQSTGIYFVSILSRDTCLISQEEHQKKKKQADSKSEMLTRATISFFKWRADSI
jgi:hypothetical protein